MFSMIFKPRIKTKILKNALLCCEYVSYGNDDPTIVFEAGLGDSLDVWHGLTDKLKGITRTFFYNRAGYGKSHSSNKNRDGNVIVEELHTVLHKLNYKPPYIVVAHSLGSAYMEIFAHKYPEDVCGLVLIDPMAVEMDMLCKKNDIKDWELSPFRKKMVSIFLSRGAKQELKMREVTLSQTQQSPACINSFPVIVISADKSMWSSQLQETWLTSHTLLVKRYANCNHIIAKDCGHHVQKENPKLVVDQILSILKNATY